MNEEELKQKALKAMADQAESTVEKYFAKEMGTLMSKGLGTKEAQEVIDGIFSKAFDELTVKDEAGKDVAVKAMLKELDTQVENLKQRIKDNDEGNGFKVKSFAKELEKSLSLQEEAIKDLKRKQGTSINFDIKAASTFLLGDPVGGTPSHYDGTFALSTWDGEMASTPKRKLFMRDLVRVVPVDNLYVHWAEKQASEGGATAVAEGAKKPQMDWKYVENSSKVEKIAVWIKVSKESLDDLKFLRGEINTELRYEVERELDEQMWDADGTAPNLEGLLPQIPTYAAGTFAGAVASANIYDVIVTAISQVETAGFSPNAIAVNPTDYYKLILTKDANGNYIRPQFLPDGGQAIAGIRIVSNSNVTAGTFVVGDFTKATLAIREDVNLDMGYENDDFTKNLVTILAELRAAFYIKNNYKPAFVKGDFATAIAAITVPAE